MRKTKFAIVPIAAAVGAMFALEASAFEFHGYLRSGGGSNSKDGDQVCFQLPGVGVKYRLGNECETYAEIAFDETLFKGKDGVEFKYHGMLAYKTRQAQDFESLKFDDSENDIALRQNWIEAKNIPFLRGATVWGGKRYYRRNDVHINDFYYWDPSGPGFGIEDINLGGAKLAYALFRNNLDTGSNKESATRHDLRAYGINLGGFGDLEIGLNYTSADTQKSDRNSGWAVNVQHFLGNLAGGFNKLALQYGTGAAASLNAYPSLVVDDDATRFRIVEQFQWQLGPSFSGMLTAVYEDSEKVYGNITSTPVDLGQNQKWLSFGIRPIWHINDYFRINFEYGYDQVKPDNGPKRTLNKFTIAPAIATGPTFWARPELRLFATYAKWNNAARDAGILGQQNCAATGVSDNPFGCNTNGTTYGFQVEAWF